MEPDVPVSLGGLADAALLDLIKAQDARAHRALFERYHGRVLSFLQRRLRDRELAEETAADVFFEIWRNAAAFRGASLASTWIFGIAHFKCLEADRHRRRMKRSQVLPTNVEFLHRVADPRDLTSELGTRAELRQVVRLIARLPAEQRATVELALVEGLSYDEIAERLGVPEGTIKARVARARTRLRSGVNLAAEEEA
jgi:RNA polymerase sigma-70 factor (ECF subfamily)